MDAVRLWVLLVTFAHIVVWQSMVSAQPPELSPRALDSLLQGCAFRAFGRPKTGIAFDGLVPSNLTGVRVSALRLRSGSLRRRGVIGYREFRIPIGVVEQPYVERLVLVYHNLANWSSLYYHLPGYAYLAPVLGLLAYSASNLSATDLSELDIRASENPILIKFSNVESVPDGSSSLCVQFGLDGSVEFNNVMGGNVCATIKQGHFAIVAESNAASPAPAGGNPLPRGLHGGRGGVQKSLELWMIAGFGGLVLLVFLGTLVIWMRRCRRRKRIQTMERTAEESIALKTASVGNSRAPVAMATRTRPSLETEPMP